MLVQIILYRLSTVRVKELSSKKEITAAKVSVPFIAPTIQKAIFVSLAAFRT
jgi:hypothetical protein